jgi:hypothetical protein
MKIRLLVILGLIMISVFGLGNVVSGQNEVTESVTTGYYGTFKLLPLGADRALSIWESFGTIVADAGEGLFHNTTIRCVGKTFREKGDFEMEGNCSYTMKDGEKVFLSFKYGGKVGAPTKGTAKMIGGTGKYSGIEGRVELVSYPLRPSAEGITQSYNKAKIIYRLP